MKASRQSEPRETAIAQSHDENSASPVRFGVEIEFHCVSRHDNRIACMAALEQTLPAGWRVVTETGLGYEAISPIYTNLPAFNADAHLVSDALHTFGARIDPFRNHCTNALATHKAWKPSCVGSRDAFHVHLDVRALTSVRARQLGLAYYNALNTYNNRWAWTGCRWTQPCPTADIYMDLDHLSHPHLFAGHCPGGKCRCRPALNIHEHYGTLEARQHPGTLSPSVMTKWIMELYALAGIMCAAPSV